MTLPFVAAAPAAVPAARPARAADAVAPDMAAAFDGVLAKSAETIVSAAPSHDVWLQAVDDPARPHDDQPRADGMVEVWMAPWLMGSTVSSVDVAVPVDDEFEIDLLGARAVGISASAPSVEVADPVGHVEPEVTTTPAPAMAPGNARSAWREAGSDVTGETAPSVSVPTSAAPAAPALPQPDPPGSRSTGDDRVAAPELGRSAAGGQAPPSTAPASRPKAADDPAKTAARAALTEAMAKSPSPAAAGPATANENVSAPIATPALTLVAERAPVMTVARATHPATSGLATPPEVLAQLAEPAPAAQPGTRHGAERRGPGEEHGQSAWARSAGYDRLVSVPASMVFPAHAAFATALDHAAPLAGGSHAAASHVPTTVGPQIVRAVQMQVVQGGGEMTLTLSPEHLGTVTLEVKVEQQRVVATLTADMPAVRGWVAAHEQDLKAGLADLGLQLDELVVKDDDRRRDDPRERPTPERRREAEPEDDAAFEVPLQ
jgi:hypothetical protein